MIYNLCPKCFKTYNYDYICSCCDPQIALIITHSDLIYIVIKLLERGLSVVCGMVMLYNLDIPQIKGNKTLQVRIDLGYHYPSAMFANLPEGWHLTEYHTVHNGIISQHKYHTLSCSELYPEGLNSDDIAFARMLNISNLDCWLDNLDPQAYKAVWTIYGAL